MRQSPIAFRLLPIVGLLCASIWFISGIPVSITSAETEPALKQLPVGQDTFKLLVDETGIYEISYADLQAAGMNVAAVDPQQFEMLYQGKSISYQFVGDTDNVFEQGEKVRFYGVQFDGSRHDQQFVEHNVYWLWANGAPSTITTAPNETGYDQAQYWHATEQFDEGAFFSFTNVSAEDGWSGIEADTWFWRHLEAGIATTFPITLPNLVSVGVDATYSLEFFANHNSQPPQNLNVSFNNNAPQTFVGFEERAASIISSTINISEFIPGVNQLNLHPTNTSGNDLLLNELIVHYTRGFSAIDNQLRFRFDHVGGQQFQIDSMSEGDVQHMIAWDVSDPLSPVAVSLTAQDVSGSVGDYRLTFGRNLSGTGEFIVTTAANVMTPSVSKYVPADLMPANGAQWVAVSHNELITEVERLATHRAAYSSLSTHVVDAADVINQFGYGYPTPDAIRSYILTAYETWNTPPEYLLLAGDATNNPRQRSCIAPLYVCSSIWSQEDINYLPTYLRHDDRYLGLVPTDYPFSLLTGDDLIPEIAVGRITAGNFDFDDQIEETAPPATQFSVQIDKILIFEAALQTDAPWTKNVLFYADDSDTGGDFCAQNEVAASHLGLGMAHTAFCLDDYHIAQLDAAAMKVDFLTTLLETGSVLVNYRGRGGVIDWGSQLMTRADASRMYNLNTPFIVLSGSSLDNNFAMNNLQSLSETMMRQTRTGSVAHWGAAGVGFDFEHDVLIHNFYQGVFLHEKYAMGDAINYAKAAYLAEGIGHQSQAFSFILLGDPAMQMPRGDAVPTALNLQDMSTTQRLNFDWLIVTTSLLLTLTFICLQKYKHTKR